MSKTDTDRFKRSRRLVWAGFTMIAAMVVGAWFKPNPEYVRVVTVLGPSILMLIGAWSGISNWAQVKRPDVGS